jgi:Mg2+ and Co2+ transporter CorA
MRDRPRWDAEVPTVTAGTLVKQRRSLKMTARALNDIDRDVFEVRQYIGHQRDVIRQLADGGHMQALPQAQETLRLLEDKLQALLMRRKVMLDEFRRPRASSKPAGSEEPGRRSGGA